MSSRTASSRRTPSKRRKSARSSAGHGMTSWLVALAVVAGGIALYDNRDTVLKEMAPLLSTEKRVASSPAKSEPRGEKPASERAAAKGTKGPVPPANVGVVKAAVPAARPAVTTATAGPLTGENFSGKFYFCGVSGLDNCVMTGDTFWYKKTKIVLADIAAPRTDGAACQQERDRGFAAEVRLKDLLSSGRFDLETLKAQAAGEASGVMRVATRNGRSLGSILVSEGLAKPRMARQQSWCP
ncbi:endonuclease YncB(thermonuclease family) [Rhizobium rosettiformans]|uniref:Nuclease n=2 Tax=Rhizobium rosettiformans TaxID=1368430 RepID=A0A4S8PWC8_9HYPH|nr:nuclease [Rhizobium rosettiformans]MBB5276479.1 endonuclease YncB(thermonuclease family) [Rhizobium rosettiformans]THV35910.1 nuclease [Rhizobium rosettiformans W3]